VFKILQSTQKTVVSSLVLFVLAACQHQPSQPVVSSTSNYKEYVYRDHKRVEQEYISALAEAQSEASSTPLSEYTVSSKKADESVTTSAAMERAFMDAIAQTDDSEKEGSTATDASGVLGKATVTSLSEEGLWGKPPAFLGDGVTILNKQVRSRFNDAIATTPSEGKVEWRYGKNQFIFMPNSPIFQPFYSGGNCRDGVFIHFDGVKNDRTRGLFCQKGPGADWYIQR
jgi:hypothetical protein